MTCFTLCERCGEPIASDHRAHQSHDDDCTRFLEGSCRCDGWVCLTCCPDEACTPLQEACRDACADTHTRSLAAEALAG